MRERCARNKESEDAVSAMPTGVSPRSRSACLLAALWLTAILFAPSLFAATLSFSGALTQDDEVVLFPFTVTGPSDATFRTLSYGGGTDANGNTISPGGFDPVLSLFDGSGSLLQFSDDGSEPDIAADPLTGLALDSYFVWSVTPGDYYLAVSQSNNYPGLTLADPFLRQGEGNFTSEYGCGPGRFFDYACNARNSGYFVEIGNVTGVFPEPPPPPPPGCDGEEICEPAPVPIPPSAGMFLTGLIGVLLGMKRRQRRYRPADASIGRATRATPHLLFTSVAFAAGIPDQSLAAYPLLGGRYEAETVEEIMPLETWGSHYIEYTGGPFTFADAISDTIAAMQRLRPKGCDPIERQGLTCDEGGDTFLRRVSTNPNVLEPIRLYTSVICYEPIHRRCPSDTASSGYSTESGAAGSVFFRLQKCSSALTKVDTADADKPGYSSTKPGLIQQYPPSDPAKVAEVAALTRKLEEGVSAYDLLSDAMKSAFNCMQGKFAAAGVPLSRADITGTVRTRAYQKHFVDIVATDKAITKAIGEDPNNALRCHDVRNAINAEQFVKPRGYNQGHGRITSPAEDKSNHEDGNAVDILAAIAAGLRDKLAQFGPPNVNAYLKDCAPAGMQLRWGGYFKINDPVHFDLVPAP